MAEDPKGIYFAPNNQGFATILPDRRDPTMFDYVERGMMQKAARKKQEEDQRNRDAEALKAYDAYRHYTPAVDEIFNELKGMLKQDNYDQVEYRIKLAEYQNMAQASMQMREYDEAAFQAYKEDSRILDGRAKEWYIKTYRPKGTLEELKEQVRKNPDSGKFLDQVGGSELINESEAFKKAIEEGAFADYIVNSTEGQALLSKYGFSINKFTKEQQKTKIKAFARYDEATGTIVVKDRDVLMNIGTLTAFQDDPYTNRIIEDRAIASRKARGLKGPVTDEDRMSVLEEVLKPYAQKGEVEDVTDDRYVTDRVPYQAYGDSQRRQAATDWVTDASQGDPKAWSFAEGGTYQGKTIIEARPNAGGTAVDLVIGDPVAPNTKGAVEINVPKTVIDPKTGDETTRYTKTWILPTEQKTINLGDKRRWNDEALLEFYRGNVPSSQAPRYNEARAKEPRGSRTGMFDNIGNK